MFVDESGDTWLVDHECQPDDSIIPVIRERDSLRGFVARFGVEILDRDNLSLVDRVHGT